jgi:hypothetical protein
MTNMTIVALITRNSMGTNELGQVLMTNVTKVAVLECGGESSGDKGRGAGWREEWVEVTLATAPSDHIPCL